MSAVTPEITGRNFEVTPEIRALLESKLVRVEDRLFDDVITVRVVLQVQKYRNICEIMIVGKEHDVKAVQESDQSMPDAINAAIDHVKRQAQKNRERITDHRKNDATTFTEAGDRVGDAGPRDVTMAEAGKGEARAHGDKVADSTTFDTDRPR